MDNQLNMKQRLAMLLGAAVSVALAACLTACASGGSSSAASASSETAQLEVSDHTDESPSGSVAVQDARAALNMTEDYRESLAHGDKPAEFQKYIVLHDTEGEGEPEDIVNYWDGNDAFVAAHFVIGKDGRIVQCVPLDKIAHHAGFGNEGHNEQFGVTEDGRDDMVGTVPIGDWMPDYGMNAWSIGIEMIHVGGSDDYPSEQLEALDKLIAYIDAYYGFESAITDHKAWRDGNSDTSEEFAAYLANYQDHRTHN